MTRELVVGAPGTATDSVYYPKALNELVGTKFKIVSGYPGGNEVNLAMERGEVGGRGSNSWASWKSTKPDWLREKKIFMLVQIALKRDPELADVPTMIELAKTDEDKAVMTFLSADIPISRAYVTTPGVPAERVQALRRAFDATMKDPQFLAEAAKLGMDMQPVDRRGGAEIFRPDRQHAGARCLRGRQGDHREQIARASGVTARCSLMVGVAVLHQRFSRPAASTTFAHLATSILIRSRSSSTVLPRASMPNLAVAAMTSGIVQRFVDGLIERC